MTNLFSDNRKRVSVWRRFQSVVWSVNALLRSVVKQGIGWLLPMILALLVLAGLLAGIAGTGPLAPFIYPII